MTPLPNTTTRGAGRRWPLYVLATLALVGLALVVEAFLRAESFSPGARIFSPSVVDVSVSAEDSLYPPPDVNRFGAPPEEVYVYLSVEDLPSGEDMRVRIERERSGSALSLLLGRGTDLEAFDRQEDQLSSGADGASGIVKFALGTRSGGPVPPGNYTLEVYGSAGEEAPAARKLFVVEG